VVRRQTIRGPKRQRSSRMSEPDTEHAAGPVTPQPPVVSNYGFRNEQNRQALRAGKQLAHSAFDKRMVRFCETGKAVTKERLPGRLLLAPSRKYPTAKSRVPSPKAVSRSIGLMTTDRIAARCAFADINWMRLGRSIISPMSGPERSECAHHA